MSHPGLLCTMMTNDQPSRLMTKSTDEKGPVPCEVSVFVWSVQSMKGTGKESGKSSELFC